MIKYCKYRLHNGLTLLVSEDNSTPLVTVNTLYNVGARDEDPSRTGFAHLFEHLMFGGTRNIPDFESVVNNVGGDSNAFTNNDYTNYYITLPARYLETALWLESDRMQYLNISQHALQVQQSVVTEEYNYRYVNQPYGDVWMLLRPLCYKVHPYRWSTIGSDIRHVQQATLDDVECFFRKFYRPNNAVIAVVGPVKADEVYSLVAKWYGDIAPGPEICRQLPKEPEQDAWRSLTVHRDVPSNAFYAGYVMEERCDDMYRAADLVSDILSSGKSSRFYNKLVKESELFTDVDAYITGESGPGLFVVSGKVRDGVDSAKALQAVDDELQCLSDTVLTDKELTKVINRFESTFLYSQYKALDCAMSFCYYERLGHVEWINEEPQLYRKVTPDDIQRVAKSLFRHEHQSVLFYNRK